MICPQCKAEAELIRTDHGGLFVCRDCKRWRNIQGLWHDYAYSECMVCGGPTVRMPYQVNDHHCDERRERAVADAQKSHDEKGVIRTQPFSERLNDGFRMLELSEDADD